MQIETYEIEDNTSEAAAMASDSAALELIESLGLTGQKRIMNTETVTRIPYRIMEKTEYTLYSAICPRKCTVEEYSDDAIPLRVLQVAAHAKSLNCFTAIQVWAADPAIIRDDPVLVGCMSRKATWGGTETVHYILARWGKTLEPVEKLIEVASKHLRAKRLAALKAIQSEIELHLKRTETTADLEVLAKSPTFYE